LSSHTGSLAAALAGPGQRLTTGDYGESLTTIPQ
jgi:hypothetical protein